MALTWILNDAHWCRRRLPDVPAPKFLSLAKASASACDTSLICATSALLALAALPIHSIPPHYRSPWTNSPCSPTSSRLRRHCRLLLLSRARPPWAPQGLTACQLTWSISTTRRRTPGASSHERCAPPYIPAVGVRRPRSLEHVTDLPVTAVSSKSSRRDPNSAAFARPAIPPPFHSFSLQSFRLLSFCDYRFRLSDSRLLNLDCLDKAPTGTALEPRNICELFVCLCHRRSSR